MRKNVFKFEIDWNRLTGLMKLESKLFDDFVSVDDAVTVCGQLDGDDIIVKKKISFEAEEDE